MKHAEVTYNFKFLETKLDYNITKAKRALCDVDFCCFNFSMLCYKTNGKRHSVHY